MTRLYTHPFSGMPPTFPQKIRLIVGVLAISTALAACGGGGEDDPSPQVTSSQKVDPTATVRYAIANPPTQFDPIESLNEAAQISYLGPLFDGLTGVEGTEVVPRLAESWEVSDDGLAWTFTVREGATFHDGSAIDAEAVVANLERALNARETNPLLGLKLGAVESVTADGATVTIELSGQAPGLAATMASPLLSIASPGSFGTLGSEPVGSGPYRLTEFTSDTATYEPFDDYWDKEHGPRAGTLQVVSIPDPQARMNALRSGQLEVLQAEVQLASDIESFASDSQFQVVSLPSQSVVTVYLNSTKGQLEDPEVRRALNWAVDREALSESLLGGLCVPTTQPFPNGAGFVEKLNGAYSYDPDKARTMLEAVGAEGLELDAIYLAAGGLSETVAPAIQAQMAEAGIELKLRGITPAEARLHFREGGADAMIHQINAELDPSMTLSNNFLALDNPSGLSGDLDGAARVAMDEPLASEARTAALEEFSEGIVAEPAHVHVCGLPDTFIGTAETVGMEEMPWAEVFLNSDPRSLGLSR